MIYLTGDTHSDFQRFSSRSFPEQKAMTKNDYVIICGDFGGIWERDPEDRSEKYWLDWLEEKPFTTLFLDGNHENFDRLDAMPVTRWHGGKIHRIRPSVLHLMRGQIYEIGGTSFFTFGGARSHDIQDGVLHADDPRLKSRRWRREKDFRVNHVNWWKHELPDGEEMEEGQKNLQTVHWKVDFILTHCMPSSLHLQAGRMISERMIAERGIAENMIAENRIAENTIPGKIITGNMITENADRNEFSTDPFTDWLEAVRKKCCYRAWFCGHYHMEHNFTEKDRVLYRQIIRIV